MPLVPDCALLGDIGATNARMALVTGSDLGAITTLEVARFRRFADAIDRFVTDQGAQGRLGRALFAVAAPINGTRCVLTNAAWVIDTSELQKLFGFQSELLNDFEAVAHSLPLLRSADLIKLGGGADNKASPMAVVGPGTGLGVACLVPGSDKPVVIQSEGGHATLSGTCDRDEQIIHHLRQRFGHVSVERAVSGPGLENLYQAISAFDGPRTPLPNATEITRSALRGECKIAVEALTLFCAFLGSFAGKRRADVWCPRRRLYSRWHFATDRRFHAQIAISGAL